MAKKPVIDLSVLTDKDPSHAQHFFNTHVLELVKSESAKPQFKDLKVYTMGSLSYFGLCPYSDIDLLVVGDKALTDTFAAELGKTLSNLKIKWWPKLDYDLAVDVFDHIALFFAQAIFENDEEALAEFKSEQFRWILKHQEEYEEALAKDRALRRSRYGVYGGELSPNIKYGPGGLRDTCQALAWSHWSAQKVAEDESKALIKDVASGAVPEDGVTGLQLLEDLILSLVQGLQVIYQVRFELQSKSLSDQLSTEIWPELLQKLNWDQDDKKNFYNIMLQQFKLTDLVFESQQMNLPVRLKEEFGVVVLNDFDVKDLANNLSSTAEDSKASLNETLDLFKKSQFKVKAYIISKYILNYFFVLDYVFESKPDEKWVSIQVCEEFKPSGLSSLKKDIFEWLNQLFLKKNSSSDIDFILDSGLLVALLKDWSYISGLTQSDHYHRYTVSEHLRQTLKAVCSLQTQRDLRFSMDVSCEELTLEDWQTLKWTAVFHDLKKGHPEDHSVLGKEAVLNFKYFSEEQKQAISCLVEHHLRLSTFAFRYEHSDETQLKSLNNDIEVSLWVRMLLVFTGADIMGSNPQAWNKWKSDQLYFAYKALMDFRNNKINSDIETIEGFELSSYLINVVGLELLKEDLLLLKKESKPKKNDIDRSGEQWLVESIEDNLWVRVYREDFGPGTLSHILNILFMAGIPVAQAFIATDKSGRYVYDWFRLPSTFKKPKAQLQKRLELFNKKNEFETKSLKATLDKVIFLTENKDKFSFLFKGNDQNGVLLFISKIFESLKVNILKAQINTWGDRIEDLFVVKKEGHSSDELLESLNKSLKETQKIKG